MSDEKVYLDDYSSTNKHVGFRNFIILSILTMGIYDIWWTYRAWRTFKEKDKEDIYPIARAIFNIFFFHALMVKVLDFAKENGYDKTYSPGMLIVAYIVFYFSGRLPDPFWLISFGSILCYVPIVKAFNYAIENAQEHKSEALENFTPKQIILVVCGILLWGLMLIGMMTPDYDTYDNYDEFPSIEQFESEEEWESFEDY